MSEHSWKAMQMVNKPKISDYFKAEKKWLLLTTITGLVYNAGLAAGPWFEGQLAQYLYDILKGLRGGHDIIILSLIYIAVIAAVQGARALKRLFVRKFGNNVTRSLKESIYHHLVSESYAEIQEEDTGAIMTRAIADAEACAEGMRKFVTEIFDTGVVMIVYLVMLFALDWRMTLMVIGFPPLAYLASAALKGRVTKSSMESKTAMSRLNDAAVDSVGNALTYRIYGEDGNREAAYETALQNYKKKNVIAGIWQNSPQPVYLMISMAGVIFILFFGGRNVLGSGWSGWTIAVFTSFLSCFSKLATKSSHAAKLFNTVQQAKVSWQRIEKYLTEEPERKVLALAKPAVLEMQNVNFGYGDGAFSLQNLNFTAHPGEIIGITGRVAVGKSTFGKLFLNEYPFDGEILYGGRDIRDADQLIFAYAGHDPELFTGTVQDNITFGKADEARLNEVLDMVQIRNEVSPETMVGMEGSALSGGQQARIVLARALYSRTPVLILDDPFAAVDVSTEKKIFESLRKQEKDRIILLISHRLELFPELDQIILLENGTMTSGSPAQMMQEKSYASLYALQCAGGESHA